MLCPRCQSSRIQRGFKDAPILWRLAGGQELLCNNCGLEFKRFRWSSRFERIPVATEESKQNWRRAARFRAHLPARIRLIDKGANNEPSPSSFHVRGHCQSLSSLGMALSFVGSRIDPAEFGDPGRLLLVVINLPDGAMEAVVKTVTHQRNENPDGPATWLVGTAIVQISDADKQRLSTYLDKRSSEESLTD
jgi:hypothetical protein